MRKALASCLLETDYIKKLYPSLKLQKPGIDLYSYIVVTQATMFVYMLLFYSNMNRDSNSILTQVTSSTLNSGMVILLFIIAMIMLYERYMYNSKTFG